jgi:hypothetical protein
MAVRVEQAGDPEDGFEVLEVAALGAFESAIDFVEFALLGWSEVGIGFEALLSESGFLTG